MPTTPPSATSGNIFYSSKATSKPRFSPQVSPKTKTDSSVNAKTTTTSSSPKGWSTTAKLANESLSKLDTTINAQQTTKQVRRNGIDDTDYAQGKQMNSNEEGKYTCRSCGQSEGCKFTRCAVCGFMFGY